MPIDKDKVIHTFCVYTDMDYNSTSKYNSIIEISILEALKMIKDDTDFKLNDTIIHYLCGVIAYYRYTLLIDGALTDVKMGDISIKTNKSDKIHIAKKIMDDAIALACDILNDNYYFSAI